MFVADQKQFITFYKLIFFVAKAQKKLSVATVKKKEIKLKYKVNLCFKIIVLIVMHFHLVSCPV